MERVFRGVVALPGLALPHREAPLAKPRPRGPAVLGPPRNRPTATAPAPGHRRVDGTVGGRPSLGRLVRPPARRRGPGDLAYQDWLRGRAAFPVHEAALPVALPVGHPLRPGPDQRRTQTAKRKAE